VGQFSDGDGHLCSGILRDVLKLRMSGAEPTAGPVSYRRLKLCHAEKCLQIMTENC
jgi:hypothetical protein